MGTVLIPDSLVQASERRELCSSLAEPQLRQALVQTISLSPSQLNPSTGICSCCVGSSLLRTCFCVHQGRPMSLWRVTTVRWSVCHVVQQD